MDLSPITDGAVTLASAGIAALSPVLAVKLGSFFKLNLDQTHRSALSSALDTALGLGLQLAKEAGDAHLTNVNVKSAALTTMIGYVKQAVPDAVSHFGLTDTAIAQQASARLATKLHSPATTVSTAVSAVASLLPAAPAAQTVPPGQTSPLPASP